MMMISALYVTFLKRSVCSFDPISEFVLAEMFLQFFDGLLFGIGCAL